MNDDWLRQASMYGEEYERPQPRKGLYAALRPILTGALCSLVLFIILAIWGLYP